MDESGSEKESEDEIQYNEENSVKNSNNEEKYDKKDETIEIDGETTKNHSEDNHEENNSDDHQNKDMNKIHDDESHDEATNFQNKEGDENMHHQDKIDAVNNNANVEIQPLIHSCFALGSSLLSQYDPSGAKRMDDLNEEEFEKNVNNFFETAECLLKDGNE